MPITPQTTCRCQTATHGHAAGQCEKVATEADGYCKYCHDRAADEWLQSQAVTAVTSLASVTSSATEVGLTDVAQAGERVQYIVINVFQAAQRPDEISDQSLEKLRSRVENLEAEALKAGLITESKKCHDEFEACLARASTTMTKRLCWLPYVTCLARYLITGFKGLGPKNVNLIKL